MTMAEFKASLSGAAPAPQLDAPLAALWWAAKGGWDQAHKIVQDEASADAAWVQNGALYYISGQGAQKCVPLSQVDRSATERLNAQKGLTLWLPPVG